MSARRMLAPADLARLERQPVTGTRFKALRALDDSGSVYEAEIKCRREAEQWAEWGTPFGKRWAEQFIGAAALLEDAGGGR